MILLHFYEKARLSYVKLSETYNFTQLGKWILHNVPLFKRPLNTEGGKIFEEMQLKSSEYIG
jgi:hypothetical protein